MPQAVGSRADSRYLLAAAMSLALAASAATAQNRCSDCHTAQLPDDSSDTHVDDWRDSSHARAGVGCEDCHRGDATTFQQLRAHRGVKHSSHPESSTYFLSVPATCGSCHRDIEIAYRSSPHAELLSANAPDAPNCTTCHGALATLSIGGGGLEARCSSCHDAGKSHPMPEQLTRGGALLRRMREIAQKRDKAGRQILRIKDLALRHEFGEGFYKADAEWDEALKSSHAIRFDDWERALSAAETGFDQLLNALAAKP